MFHATKRGWQVAGCLFAACLPWSGARAQITTPQQANGISLVLNQPINITTTATGTAGYDLWAQNNGVITATTNSFTLVSQLSQAVVAQSGGKITLDGTGGTLNITSQSGGINVAAVLALGGNSSVNLTGATIATGTASTSASYYGARAQTGGNLTLANSTVTLGGTAAAGGGLGPTGISIEGAGSAASLTNVTVNVSTLANESSVGILAATGAVITGNGVSIAMTSGGSSGSKLGIQSNGTGSQITLSNVIITGSASVAANQIVTATQALSGGRLTINGGSISGNGISSGFNSNGVGAVATANNLVITSSKAGSGTMVAASNGGTTNFTGGSITTSAGFGWIAAQAAASNSILNLNNTTVTLQAGSINASGGVAIDAFGPATVNVNGSTITANSANNAVRVTGAFTERNNAAINFTNGTSLSVTGGTGTGSLASYGVLIDGTGNSFSSADSSISTFRVNPTVGLGVNGIQVQNNGTASLQRTTVNTTGTDSIGIAAIGTGSVTLTDATQVTTNGTNAHGLSIQNGASITATDSGVLARGTGANALRFSGTGTGTATFTRGTLTSASAAAIAAAGGTGMVSLNGTTVTGTGNWLDVATGATANVTATNGATLNGAVTTATGGASTIAVNSGSTWNISGNSTVTNLSFDGGVLHYTAAATLTTPGPIQLNAGGATVDTNGFNTTLAQVLAGTGPLTTAGGGTLVLTADNTYTGGTTVAAGTLQLGNGGASGSVTGDILDNGILAFNRSDVVTYANVVSGSGSLEQRGPGTLILTNDNTYAGTTTIAAGTLQVGDGGVSGSLGTGAVIDNGALVFNRADTVSQAAAISGTGTLEQAGTGTLILTGDNIYAGTTTIAAGTLQVGDGGASGSLGTGAVIDNGALVFNRADTVTQAASISGTGTLEQAGTGTLVLTADNTYTGGTTISAGTLQLGDDGASGSVTGDILDNGALVFNRSDVVTYAGIVSGSGTLEQAGTGTLVLTADNTHTGGTIVSAGTLVIGDSAHPDASLSGGGPISIAAGAVFGGYGSVTGDVTNDGALAVGAAIDALAGGPPADFRIAGDVTNNGLIRIGSAGVVGNSLTIAGNYIGNGALALNARLDGDGSPSDLLIISGAGHAATGLTSLTVTNVGGLGSFTDGNGIQVVRADGGAATATGAFALGGPVAAGPYEYSLYRGARDGSDPEGWYLRNDRPAPPSPEPTPVPGTIPDYRREVSLYSTVQSQAQNYGRALLDTLHERTGDDNAATNGGNTGNAVWGRIVGQHNSRSNGGGIYSRDGAAFRQDIYAFQFGLDLLRRDHADGSRDRAGIYVAVGRSEADITHYTGTRAGTDTLDAYTVGAYWTHFAASGWYTDAVVQATKYSADLNSGRGFRLKNDGYGLAASLEGGYVFRLSDGFTVEPQAQIVYQRIGFDSGHDGAADIRFGDANSLAGRIGVRIKKDWALDDGDRPRVLSTWVRANLWHEFLADNKVAFSSQGGPLSFHSDMGGSWLEVQAGVSAQLSRNAEMFASAGYQSGFSGDRHAYNGKLGLRFTW